MQPLQKATLTKTEVRKYLGIGELRLSKLLINPSFPKPKPIIEKWSKVEIDNWLNNANIDQKTTEPQSLMDFLGTN